MNKSSEKRDKNRISVKSSKLTTSMTKMTSSNNDHLECSLPTRFHRRKFKLKQMFISSLNNLVGLGIKTLYFENHYHSSAMHTLQGLFLVLDYRARRVYSQCVEVWCSLEGNRVSFRLHDRMKYSRDKLQYLWTDSGRWKRIKGPPPKLNRVEGKNKCSVDNASKKVQPTQFILNWSKKGREGYRLDRNKETVTEIKEPSGDASSENDDSSEDDEEWGTEYPDVKPNKRPYEKSIKAYSKRYLLGKGGVSHNSKVWRREMDCLKLTTIEDCREIDDDGDRWRTFSRRRHLLTFGDFCSSPNLKNFRNDKSFKIKAPIHTSGDLETKSSNQNITLQPGVQRKCNYIMVKLNRAQTRPDVLSDEFKLDYREAPCKPRRFVLNISRLMYQHAILITRLRVKFLPKLDLSTYLVFTFSRTLGPDVDEYRMAVNSARPDLLAHAGSEERYSSNEFTPIQELIIDVVSSLDGIDLAQFKQARDISQKRPIRPVCLFNALTSVFQWETKSLSLPYTTEWCMGDTEYSNSSYDSSNDVFVAIINILRNRVDYRTDIVNSGPSISHLCGVCLSEFNSGTASENQIFLLALAVCSHWFCEDCWKSRVLIQLRNGHNPCDVPCPEKDCPGRLDPVTILSVFSVQEIRKLNHDKIERYAAKTSSLTFCPGPACHRLLWALPRAMSQTTSITVTCDCSTQVCFDCLREPHWPVPCLVAKEYHQELTTNGEEVLGRLLSEMEFPEVVMRGKRCPTCGLFIFQASSSKTYTCSCGCQFCWPCGKEMKEADDRHQLCVETFQHSDKVLKDIVNNGQLALERQSKMPRWYGTALAHRKMRHPDVVMALYSMAESMANNISILHESGHYVGDIETAATGWSRYLVPWARENCDNLYVFKDLHSESQGVNENSRSVSRASSASIFGESGIPPSPIVQATENIVQTKLELHHIIEYTSVLMARVVPVPAKLAQCLERAEDLCTTFGILLQNKKNCRQVLPAFVRLRTKVNTIVGHILTNVEENPSWFV